MDIHAFAALKPREALRPFTYELSPLAPFEVLLKVSHCGLCHSDIHLIDDDWKRSKYPLVPGHEVVGTVTQKGSAVETLHIGQRVGVSWIHSSCLHCPSCVQGDTNLCGDRTATCNGHHGGFADQMVADSRFAYPIPEGLDSPHAAPLLCAGATVYTPLCSYGVQGFRSVAVLGIGGLGHIALQFAAAFGCEVTALSHSASKEADAKTFGAHHFFTLDKLPAAPQFDLILSTVHADLDWNRLILLLKPKGTLCFLGRPDTAASIDIAHLVAAQRNLSGSATANRARMNEMLAFAAHHQIKPKIERFPLAKVNEAIERVKTNAIRYRAVLEI